MSVHITFSADDRATLAGLVASFASTGPSVKEELMPLFDDIMAKIADLKTAAADEHTQVMAAIQGFQDQINSGTGAFTPDQVNTLNAGLDDVKAAIAGVFEPPAPTPTPPPA